MKTAVYFKHFLSAFAALTLVCIVSSCRDQNFDWDAAHATEQYQKFTDVFIKEFGKPAPGHQWGFDAANAAITGINTSTAVTRADGESDGYVWKQEMYINNVPAVVQYGKPEDITPREHLEVYAWFLMHKVYWSNTPVNFDTQTKESTRQTVDDTNTAYVRSGITGDYAMTYAQALTQVNNMAKAEGLKNSDGTYFQLDRLSFLDAAYNNDVNDYVFDTNLYFRNAWIQHVANDNNIIYDDDEKDYTNTVRTSAQMDYLRCWALTSDDAGKWGIHLFDFNGAQGYGWWRQPSCDKYNSIGSIASSGQNADLVINCDVNTWTYGCSIGSSAPHDKYYMVYLKGDDYEGWYLGMDLEGFGDTDSQKLDANGVCNDWIIKIGDAGSSAFTRSRIMCEDLGGSAITASDIDYNDIVMDFDYEGQGNTKRGDGQVKLTVRAAGGTMPLVVFYDNDPLFEVHEFLKNGKIWTDANRIMPEAEYMIMYNTNWTGDNTGDAKPAVYQLGFNVNPSQNYQDSNGNWINCPNKRFDKGFDLNKLQIKVFRPFEGEQGSVANYISSASDNGNVPTSEAYWVTLENIDGEAPLKICVPQKYANDTEHVKWMQERVRIDNGYSLFRAWVGNPTKLFWESPSSGTGLFHWGSEHYPN